ncbi:Cell wall-associated hydrolase, NlpC family [Amycolatopsis arida]|uniref:Cell wall-associated hydrolase, NlpC family n=1 Tax=Amycolatopsis arida TaxID=587909 RepID=A0A1I5XXF2_9PSEU|nr:C40 family peptidase [Amycolatopsis arida]TDX97211.1 cell wall-associated NlpC family hydrolase [Amycolatopsis arida]SFQ36550.1 Cell wall-associated hydrolase, NlpC family [Amycolatopsis arida]
MRSQLTKRVLSGALAASAVIAIAVQVPATATPQPVPLTPPGTSSSDALAQYRELGEQAEKLNEEYLVAKEDLAAKRAELEKATADLEAARQAGERAAADEEVFRAEVDRLAGTTFTSGAAQLTKLSALLSGSSANDFLDRSAALDMLAAERNQVLRRLAGAVDQSAAAERQAADARARAQAAKDEAAKLTADIEQRKSALDEQIRRLERAHGLLSSADRAAQRDTGGPIPSVKAPGPAAQTAVDAALSKIGSNYRLGEEGPREFDCSGLTLWAYRQAGITLPRTARSQQGFGTPVSRQQLQPGDLVFFGSPAYHVGIYLGGGKMVHAPQPGEVVKISSVQSGYSGARRVA